MALCASDQATEGVPSPRGALLASRDGGRPEPPSARLCSSRISVGEHSPQARAQEPCYPSRPSMSDTPLHLFEGTGIELEYMIVDAESLSVKPVADELLKS